MASFRIALLSFASALAACAVDVETSPYAHESPGADHSPIGLFLGYSTYLGGNGADDLLDVQVTGGVSPRIFVAGTTASTNFPTTDGTDAGGAGSCGECPRDAFVARYDAPGRVVWSTLVGASAAYESATAIAVGLDLDVFVGGSAGAGLPITPGVADATFAGGATAARGDEDGYVCRLDGDTGERRWCTYLGGNGPGGVTALVADPAGDGVIALLPVAAGDDVATDPIYAAALAGRHRATPQGADVLAVRLSADGLAITWATFVGGTGAETGTPALARDLAGVHVLTETTSTDAPVVGGFATTGGAYYALLSADGTTLQYATYAGGTGDRVSAQALSAGDGHAFLGLTTRTPGLPTTIGGLQPTFAGAGTAPGCAPDGAGDAWIAIVRPTATGAASLVGSTYLGGSLGEHLHGVSYDRGEATVLVTGRTFSNDFPRGDSTNTLFQDFRGVPCASLPGNSDGFFVSVPSGLGFLRAWTYLGGDDPDRALAARASAGNAITAIAGTSSSTDFPLRRGTGADTQTFAGATDGTLTVIGPWDPAPDPTIDGGVLDGGHGSDGGDTPADGDGGGCCGAAPGPGAGLSAALLAFLVALSLVRRRQELP